jgi:hypothetical protein
MQSLQCPVLRLDCQRREVSVPGADSDRVSTLQTAEIAKKRPGRSPPGTDLVSEQAPKESLKTSQDITKFSDAADQGKDAL